MFERKSFIRKTAGIAAAVGVLALGPGRSFAAEGDGASTTTPATVEVGAPPVPSAEVPTETTLAWGGVTRPSFPDFGSAAEVSPSTSLPNTGVIEAKDMIFVGASLVLVGVALVMAATAKR